MLRSRIIPSLLLSGSGLIKTKAFKRYKYIGDVINAIKIFNEKEVDELCLYDVDATTEGRALDECPTRDSIRKYSFPFSGS